MDLTFNMIFTPGTVRYLHLAALSLVRMSPYRYRLVANGLTGEEQAQLQLIATGHERLDFFAYPTRHVLEHGTILNLLQQRERCEYFCFLDSDIFAFQPFHVELEQCLETCDVVSSCLPLAVEPTMSRCGFEGNCLQTPEGLELAPTYFSVYRNDPLTSLVRETGVGFENFSAGQLLPVAAEKRCSGCSFPRAALIDTGKLLNVLSHGYGNRIRHYELLGLVHIGGLSSYIARARKLHRWGLAAAASVGRPYVLCDNDLRPDAPKVLHLSWIASRRIRRLHAESDIRAAQMLSHTILRDRIAIYFTCFLRHLFDGTPPPIAKLHDRQTAQRIEDVRNTIQTTFHRETSRARAA